ncbi:MAG: sigma-70 family RNA polymerase sigma factor [Acidobacteria bacterium]|nr:sigma-70 family RNA polymerase sigma factor [Acidobacteriota bacterium]
MIVRNAIGAGLPVRHRPCVGGLMPEAEKLVEHFFRHESGRLVARLTASFGTRHLGLIEDVVQTALLRALSSWSLRGILPDPSAWLAKVARNLAIDRLRRDLRWNSLDAQAPVEVNDWHDSFDAAEQEIDDALLRMLFVCCDEAVPAESQIALALRTLCGFDVREISRALLTSEANVAKRITRAKEKFRTTNVNPTALTPTMIRQRLPSVLSAVYLLFNEGYSSTLADRLIRHDLCEEAIRLALLTAEHPLTAGAETAVLVALLLFHASRLEARLDDAGSVLLLEEQDRTRWDAALIAEGFRWFSKAAAGDEVTRYHAEAWISAEHCRAASFRDTDWNRIIRAYDLLVRLAPSPIHELSRAIAIAERDGPDAGWEALQAIDAGRLPEQYHLWAATAGELARRRGRIDDARRFLIQTQRIAPTNAERELLQRRLELLQAQ